MKRIKDKFYGCEKIGNIWRCRTTIKKKQIVLYSGFSEVEGAMAWDNYVIENNLNKKLNFPIKPETTIRNTVWIYLSRDKWALIDKKNYKKVSKHTWHAKYKNGNWYAETSIKINNKYRCVLLHRLILGIDDPKIFVDHIDHNGLNDMEINMRKCSNTENQWNQIPRTGVSSIHKGVYLDKSTGKYVSYIKRNGKIERLGYFEKERDAGAESNKALLKYHKEFAHLNKDEHGNIL